MYKSLTKEFDSRVLLITCNRKYKASPEVTRIPYTQIRVYGIKKNIYPHEDPRITGIPPEYIPTDASNIALNYFVQFLPYKYGLTYLDSIYDNKRFSLYWKQMTCEKQSMVSKYTNVTFSTSYFVGWLLVSLCVYLI